MDIVDHARWRESVVLVSVVMTELLVVGRARGSRGWLACPTEKWPEKQETLPAGRVNG
jgi:hypothetical protein